MCEPVSLGIATAATGAASAVGNYQQGQAQADAANASSQSQYRARLQSTYQQNAAKKTAFNTRKAAYNEQLYSNTMAANRAYESQQQQLNEIYKAAAFQQQGALTQLLSKQGQYTSLTGKSADRLNNNLSSQFGRNQAISNESLRSALSAYRTRSGDIRRNLSSSNKAAYNKLGVPDPMSVAPPEPVKVSGPSGFGLATELGGAALGGYNTFNTLNRLDKGYDIPPP